MTETLFDYETKLLTHKRDPDTSREAAQKMIKSGKLNKQESMVLSQIKIYLRRCHKTVFTARDVSTFSLSWDNYFVIQRRLSGLHRKGYIEKVAEDNSVWTESCGKQRKKRDGCAVWRLK